jgi:hypothetical protein
MYFYKVPWLHLHIQFNENCQETWEVCFLMLIFFCKLRCIGVPVLFTLISETMFFFCVDRLNDTVSV